MTVPRHRSLEAEFFGALPPRPVPWARRTGLWLLPRLLAFAPLRWLFMKLRGSPT
ncbi:MAG: hypothetical protein NT064_01620 [Proteobacteria bacterium]|jgi:hypothetical protein|nr:hypothetical protein [Pseudomonadota bacterium]